jgi:hypothetical protein
MSRIFIVEKLTQLRVVAQNTGDGARRKSFGTARRALREIP